MDGVGIVACQVFFLVWGTCVWVLVGGVGSLLSGVQLKCPLVCFGVSVGLAWLWTAHLLMFRVVFLFCWQISMVCLALDLVGSWVELGFSVDVELGFIVTVETFE